MKIAIIGGGASGMATAHMLAGTHHITVFEKESVLGGNIRTLNGNMKGGDLPNHMKLELGSVVFNREAQPQFHKLLKELNVSIQDMSKYCSSGLYLNNNKNYFVPSIDVYKKIGLLKVAKEIMRLRITGLDFFRFFMSLSFVRKASKRAKRKTIEDLMPKKDKLLEKWLRSTLMLAYSMPYDIAAGMSAAYGVSFFREYSNNKYSVIPGGVYSYIERIRSLNQYQLTIHCDARIHQITRSRKQVVLDFHDGSKLAFDKVIFATTPDQVLTLLASPTEEEQRRFNNWEALHSSTIIHSDQSMYQRYTKKYDTVMDYFEKEKGGFGYNVYMNTIYNIDGNIPYYLSFDMDGIVKEEHIVSRCDHITPLYTAKALQYCDEIKETNGENNTYHVGAYLIDGFQEGAIVSAKNVARLLAGPC